MKRRNIVKSQSFKNNIFIIIAVLLGMVGLCIIRIGVARYNKSIVVSNAKEQMNQGEVGLAVCSGYLDEKMQSIPLIEWWYSEENEKYYLFLPQSFKNNPNVVWVVGEEVDILLDGNVVDSGDSLTFREEYEIIFADGAKYELEIMYSGSVASLFLNLESGDLDYIHENKENEEKADYILLDENGKLNNYGLIESFSCRGNASFTDTEKKSYRLKLKESQYLLGLGEDRDWILLANAFDETLSKNMIVNTISHRLNMNYVPDMDYVDVYANGEYLGNYLLSEKIEIDNDRVNIRDLEKETQKLNLEVDLALGEVVIEDPNKLYSRKWHKIDKEPMDYTGGYLMEIELIDRYGLEESGFITSRMQAVVVHSPKYASLNQIGYVADLYQDFENAVFSDAGLNEETGKYFYEYIDMKSFAQKYMIEELSKNLDASYTSFFLYVPENDGKLYAGPIWDYDKALGINTTTNEGIELNDPEGLYAAYKKKDSDILYALYQQKDFRKYLNEFHKSELRGAVEYVTEIYIDENTERIVDAALMDDVRWHKLDEGNTLEEKRNCFYSVNNEIKRFLNTRMDYLDAEWDSSK